MKASSRLIAVTGGIGAGKSVVCRILHTMGYNIYDCDSRAREIMDNDPAIKQKISTLINPLAITADGRIDRKVLAETVFNDKEKLRALNGAVHSAVLADLRRWQHETPGELLFVETAILYESGMDAMVDAVWEVRADKEVRIGRVCRRNGMEARDVEKRIASQGSESAGKHTHIIIIENNGSESLLEQINAAIVNSI